MRYRPIFLVRLLAVVVALLVSASSAVRARAAEAPPRLPPRISASIGPASSSKPVLRGLVREGIGVARLNTSFGTGRKNVALVERIRGVAAEEGRAVEVAMDLPGPKVRLGDLPNGKIQLAERQRVTLSTGRDTPADAIPVRRRSLSRGEIGAGDTLLLRDGKVHLRVESVDAERGLVQAEVTRGGELTSRAGVAVAGRALPRPIISAVDKRRLPQILAAHPDQLWVSFTESAANVDAVRDMVKRAGASPMPRIYAKLETPAALEHLDEILRASDGVVIAWGDLQTYVPIAQRARIDAQIVARAQALGKPVIAHTGYADGVRTGAGLSAKNVRELGHLATIGADYVGLDETSNAPRPVETARDVGRVVAAAAGRSAAR